jgi:RNA polymerase subunit RPABC4/transcription elongation factor Spt4
MVKNYCFECDCIIETEEDTDVCPYCGTEDIIPTDTTSDEYEIMKAY